MSNVNIYLASLDISLSDDDDVDDDGEEDDEDDDDDDEFSCFRRGGFCMAECVLSIVLYTCICIEKSDFYIFPIKSYFAFFPIDVTCLLPDESESRFTGTT